MLNIQHLTKEGLAEIKQFSPKKIIYLYNKSSHNR